MCLRLRRAKIQTCWRQFVWRRIFILNFFAQNSKVHHIQIIPTQNPSVVQKNYSEKKCLGTLPLSSYSQNIYFARLVIELHTGENSRFSIKRRRNVDILPDPCEFDLRFLAHRSQRLQWPIVITRCPASVVRPSVVRPSSVRLCTFSTSSPEPVDGFWWNLVWMKYSRSLTSVVVFPLDPCRGGSRAGQK